MQKQEIDEVTLKNIIFVPELIIKTEE